MSITHKVQHVVVLLLSPWLGVSRALSRADGDALVVGHLKEIRGKIFGAKYDGKTTMKYRGVEFLV